jgi:hypothetical protein
MAGSKIDGAGMAKLKTLEEAVTQLQRLHMLTETYALELKRGKGQMVVLMQIKRVLPGMVGLLKGQFGMISDRAAALNLAASRGGSDAMRLRTLREGVAGLRQELDIAEKRVRAQHTKTEAPDQ